MGRFLPSNGGGLLGGGGEGPWVIRPFNFQFKIEN